MTKKLVKQISQQAFEVPGGIARTAAEQVGLRPRPELNGGRKQTKEELEKKAKEDKEKSMKRAAQIKEEIRCEVRRRKEAEIQSQRAEELEEREKGQEKKKPLGEPTTRRPRGLWRGLRSRLEKARPELAGRRVSG